jgi:hypothetical protein
MDDACVVDRPERLSESTCETDDRVEAEGSAVGYCFCQGRAIDVLSCRRSSYPAALRSSNPPPGPGDSF